MVNGLSMALRRAYGQLGHIKVNEEGRRVEIRPGEKTGWYTISGENLKLMFCIVKNNIEIGAVTASEVLSTYAAMFRGPVPRRYFYYFLRDFLDRLGCIHIDRSGRPSKYKIKGELFSENADSKEGMEKLYAGVKRALGLKTNEAAQKGGKCEEEVQNKSTEKAWGSFDNGGRHKSRFRRSCSSSLSLVKFYGRC